VKKIIQSPEVGKKLAEIGLEVVGATSWPLSARRDREMGQGGEGPGAKVE
jgi:hypothetical protein